MRYVFLSLAMVVLGSLTGCCGGGRCNTCGNSLGNGNGSHAHMHGICDCEFDDYCSSRAPWIRTNAVLAPPVDTTTLPEKLPEGKKKL